MNPMMMGPPPGPHGGHGRRAFKPIKSSGAEIIRLTPNNALFSENNGFVSLSLGEGENKTFYNKVSLRRCFPFELKEEYISVLDEDGVELGLIYNLSDFNDAADILKREIERRYYEPEIDTIQSIKERYGFSYWKVTLSDKRKCEFTMQDTFRNIVRAGDKAILLDVDGNRFVIKSLRLLDKRSFKKLELYL